MSALPVPKRSEYSALAQLEGPVSYQTLPIAGVAALLHAYQQGRVRGDEIRRFVFEGRVVGRNEAIYCGVKDGIPLWWIGGA